LPRAADRLSQGERTLRARIAANEKWAHADPVAGTAKARAKFLEGFLDEVDPNRELPEEERLRRAENARAAYFSRLAFKSAKARRQRKQLNEEGAPVRGRRPVTTSTKDHDRHSHDHG
jgi:hypothetical protein